MNSTNCGEIRRSTSLRAAKGALGAMFTAILMMVAQGSGAAGRVFFDDFESGGTGKWSFPGTFNHATVVGVSRDGKSARTGSKMLEGNWDGTVAWNDPRTYTYATLPTWSYNKEFLIRLWLRYDADVDHKFGAKVMRLGPGANMYYMGAQMETWPNAQMYMAFETISGVPGPATYNGGLAAGDGNWHKIEIYIKHNTVGLTDGIVRVWNDGVMRINSTNIKSVSDGGNWLPLNLMSNWSSNGPEWAHDANNHVYWDDIEIFSDTGTGGIGSLSDASIQGGAPPPGGSLLPAPKNLR